MLLRRFCVGWVTATSKFLPSVIALGAALAACESSPGPADADVTIGGNRPVSLFMTPDAWDGKTPLPLLLVIHGYTVGGLAQALYFNLEPLVNEKQIILVAPDGLFDNSGKRYWNAVDTCCDYDHRGEDDVAYLTGVVDEIASRYPVDLKRVYVIGHANGGAMALRLACDASSKFAAVFELAGQFWSDPATQCQPSAPIALRVLHGTADPEVPYDGGSAGNVDSLFSPGALTIASFFAGKNGCSTTPDTSPPPLDLEAGIAGAETTVTRYTACQPNGDVEVWAIQGGTHIPYFQPNFNEVVWDFFAAHSR